jgi:hypothetical protein
MALSWKHIRIIIPAKRSLVTPLFSAEKSVGN